MESFPKTHTDQNKCEHPFEIEGKFLFVRHGQKKV